LIREKLPLLTGEQREKFKIIFPDKGPRKLENLSERDRNAAYDLIERTLKKGEKS
jgi:hypothetical protein